MLFLHMPKTGGSWVTQAVSAAGVATWAPDPLGDRSYSAHGHADLHDVGVDDRLSVAFIRHPLDWWRSYWGHRMRAGWDRTIGIDAIAANDDFNRFVLALLDHHRGSFDEIVRRFVGLPSPCVDFVGRFENLVEDTCEALRLGGERFSASAIRQHPRVNVNDYRTFPALYRREVAVRLAEAEHQTIERFYADDPIPANLLEGAIANPCSPPRIECNHHSDAYNRQRSEERVRALERALGRSRQAEASLQRALTEARTERDQTTCALESLRNSQLLRRTRTLRSAYYRVREPRRLSSDHRSAAASAAHSE
jgi:hypothetical protein